MAASQIGCRASEDACLQQPRHLLPRAYVRIDRHRVCSNDRLGSPRLAWGRSRSPCSLVRPVFERSDAAAHSHGPAHTDVARDAMAGYQAGRLAGRVSTTGTADVYGTASLIMAIAGGSGLRTSR